MGRKVNSLACSSDSFSSSKLPATYVFPGSFLHSIWIATCSSSAACCHVLTLEWCISMTFQEHIIVNTAEWCSVSLMYRKLDENQNQTATLCALKTPGYCPSKQVSHTAHRKTCCFALSGLSSLDCTVWPETLLVFLVSVRSQVAIDASLLAQRSASSGPVLSKEAESKVPLDQNGIPYGFRSPVIITQWLIYWSFSLCQ